ncbi:hypothetical protein [Leifsonia aquatica]|uniref:hypothetical protein n=1 Tax=Leifsonia aquatica TaxID=144185 RepID=UPI00380CFE0C
MTVRDEVNNLFEDAQRRIREARSPQYVAPVEGAPSAAAVALLENQNAVKAALLLLAERIDAIEQPADQQ